VAKIKVVPVPFQKNRKSFTKAIEDYFAIAGPEEIEKIKLDIFHPLSLLLKK